MSETRKARGDYGEECAARYLSERGFEILARQWRCPYGELDVIARDPYGVICFVEVKLRGRNALAAPWEFVDRRKQERLRKTAAYWLSLYAPDAPARFDVAGIRDAPGGQFTLDYLPDAFS